MIPIQMLTRECNTVVDPSCFPFESNLVKLNHIKALFTTDIGSTDCILPVQLLE